MNVHPVQGVELVCVEGWSAEISRTMYDEYIRIVNGTAGFATALGPSNPGWPREYENFARRGLTNITQTSLLKIKGTQ